VGERHDGVLEHKRGDEQPEA